MTSTRSFADLQLSSSPRQSLRRSHGSPSQPLPVSPSNPGWGQWSTDEADLDSVSPGHRFHQHLHHDDLAQEQQHMMSSSLDHQLNLFLDENQKSYQSLDQGVDDEELNTAGDDGGMGLGGFEEVDGGQRDFEGPIRARTRLQAKSLKTLVSPSQPYPSTSPQRSRSSSFRVQLPPPLSSSSLHSASSPFIPISGYTSPFRQTPTTPSATMDPSQSLRSSSPSSAGSPPMSRVGSSSTSSSLYGGESILSRSATTTSVGGSPSSRQQPSLASSTLLSVLSSPSKKSRSGKKLTNGDRKNICLFREEHPTLKQDLIAEHFHVERSTVSKILKDKDRWLAIVVDSDGVLELSTTGSAPTTPNPPATPSSSPFKPFKPLSSSSSSFHDSLSASTRGFSPSPSRGITPPTNSHKIVGGRFPELDNRLFEWARGIASSGQKISDEDLHDKALELAVGIKGCENFRGSASWIEGFKSRGGLVNGTFGEPSSLVRKKFSLGDGEEDREFAEEEDDDEDFEIVHRTRAVRGRPPKRTASLSASRRRGLVLGSPGEVGMARAASPSTSRMDVDRSSTTPHKMLFEETVDVKPEFDTTPRGSYSQQHTTYRNQPDPSYFPSVVAQPSSSSSLQRAKLTPLSSTSYSPPPSASSDVASFIPYPYQSFSAGSGTTGYAPLSSTSDTQPQYSPSLQSPFQNSPTTFGAYDSNTSSRPGSGTNSPATAHSQSYTHHHGRSASIASTTSSFSGLTTFSSSSQTSTALSGSYSSYSTSTSQSNPGSLPSTPSYFSHGPDGTQSQLQAAFVVHPTSSQTSTASPPSRGTVFATASASHPPSTRRATISGGATTFSNNFSFRSSSSGNPQPPLHISASRPPSSHQRNQPSTGGGGVPVSLDQALLSLQKALEFLSHDGQGIVTPADLVALSDVKGKLAAAQTRSSPHSPPLLSQSQLSQAIPWPASALGGASKRVKLGRTLSGGSLHGMGMGLGLGSSRSNSSGSLLSVFDAPNGVDEESGM